MDGRRCTHSSQRFFFFFFLKKCPLGKVFSLLLIERLVLDRTEGVGSTERA